jgi:hypothetical protein
MSKILILAVVLLCILCASRPAHAQAPQAPPFAQSLVEYPSGGPFSLDPDCVVTNKCCVPDALLTEIVN